MSMCLCAERPSEDAPCGQVQGPLPHGTRGLKVFNLKMGEREDTVSRVRLKPNRAVADPVPATLRGHGRHPGAALVDTFDLPD